MTTEATRGRVLVVEDEPLIAVDIEMRLRKLGYSVVGSVAVGEDALAVAKGERPDVVLMDIMLEGRMDGVETAGELRASVDVPVVYLTAYSDDETLERAKAGDPFGYVLKPYSDRELVTAIEIARYKHDLERKLRQSERWLSTALHGIGDGVVAVNELGMVRLMNPRAEEMTGWGVAEALGVTVDEVVRLRHEVTGEPLGGLLAEVLEAGGVLCRENEAEVVRRGVGATFVDETAAAIRDDAGKLLGGVLVLRDAAARKVEEEGARLEMIPLVLDALGAMVLVVDPAGRVVRFNGECEAVSGLAYAEVRGRPVWDLAATPEDGAAFRAAFDRVLTGDGAPRHCSRWAGVSGPGPRVAWAYGAVRGADGAMQFVIGTGVPVDPA